jgi:hypothetical protein
MSNGRSGLTITSEIVLSCRGDAERVRQLAGAFAPMVDGWIAGFGRGCDPAAVRDVVDRSIRPGTFRGIPTLVRVVRNGRKRRLMDLLLWATDKPNPAKALCAYVRIRTIGCCREDRRKGQRRGAPLDDQEPTPAKAPFYTLADRERLCRVLDELPKAELITIDDYYFHAMPRIAIARHLKTTPRTVNRLLESGRNRLRKILLQLE